MTKNKKDELIWRLKERPSAEGVSTLVAQGVISTDEARELLFSKKEEKDTSEENRALKEQIKFLQGLVETLTRQRSTTTYVPYAYTVKTPSRYWDDIGVWCKTTGAIDVSTLSTFSKGSGVNESMTLSVKN